MLDVIASDPKMANNHLYAAVRADVLIQAGRYQDARAQLTRAIALTSNQADHDLLRAHLASLPPTVPPPA